VQNLDDPTSSAHRNHVVALDPETPRVVKPHVDQLVSDSKFQFELDTIMGVLRVAMEGFKLHYRNVCLTWTQDPVETRWTRLEYVVMQPFRVVAVAESCLVEYKNGYQPPQQFLLLNGRRTNCFSPRARPPHRILPGLGLDWNRRMINP